MVLIKKYILPLITIISVVGIGVYFLQEKYLDKNHQEIPLAGTLEKLSRVWTTGELNGFDAPECSKVNIAFRKCNPHFLKCLAKNNYRVNNFAIHFPTHQKNLPYQIIDGRYLWIELKNKEKSKELLLENICRETILDEGDYAIGPQSRNDFIWNNLGRKIFIDKFQVLNWEIEEWLDQEGKTLSRPDNLKKYEVADWLLPEQMQQYCHFRGGQVSMAHVLDAAFFYKTYDRGDTVLHRSPYPWQPKGRKTFLKELKKKDFKLEKSHCKKIPALECRELLSPEEIYKSSPTWSGVFQALGGHMEYTRNPLRPRRNVNVSSWYFPLNSSWHQVGRRAYWDGKGHALSNFTFSREDPSDKVSTIGVAFRCMRFDDD